MPRRRVYDTCVGFDDLEMSSRTGGAASGRKSFDHLDDDVRDFEENRMRYIDILRRLRKEDPMASPEKLELLATKELFEAGPKSRAYYRLATSRKITGRAKVNNYDSLIVGIVSY